MAHQAPGCTDHPDEEARATVGFEAADHQPSFPALEEIVLGRWKARDTFARSLAQREGAPTFVFYDGPMTANGMPGAHHVEARVFKDVFPRYRTMKGYRVPRQGGWDCHGIPVEIEVEKELGFTRKQDIEDYGIAKFNARCRESVQRYVSVFESLTERIAFWVDTEDAYWTMSDEYVDSVWWSLKELWDKGLIYEGHRVAPYCPRCGTALSDHEVAMGYAQADDPEVYVRFPLTDGPLAEEGAALLVWTTTPWTLISNTAVAVGTDVRYVLASHPDLAGPVVVAADLLETALGSDAVVVRDVPVDELLGAHYAAPFDYVAPAAGTDGEVPDWRYVTAGDFVTTTDGSGLVHIAPAFGADDMDIARREGLPVVNPVDLEGCFDDRVTDFAGQFVKDADAGIVAALDAAGLLVRSGTYTHTYPFCWRCRTPLLYYAKPSWYIATTTFRDRLLAENAKLDWHPEHIRDGRFGDWLSNNIDWSLSRERYWGTPLPLWRCSACPHVTAIGSRAELARLAGEDLTDLDPHRPWVDDVHIDCAGCGGERTATRVPEVIDVWYDSGAMPFAQLGYPHVEGSAEAFATGFPADFIAEGIDQTRGWFYSLLAVSTLLFDQSSYKTVLCLGLLVDAEGKRMSKSLGNILDPWELIERHGADALRWLLLTDGSPWLTRRVSHEALDEITRKFLLTIWNTTVFFTTYAALEDWEPGPADPAPAERPVMDRWVLAELAATVSAVDTALEGFDATAAGRALESFVDDLSNWYVRRSRARFWKGSGADANAAFATLHTCLSTLSHLLAPLVPFLADELHERIVRTVDPDAPDSVHLADFPKPATAWVDDDLRAAMGAARRVVELGRRARNEASIGTRQPLSRALITLPREARAGWDLVAGVVADELNVKSIELPSEDVDLVTRHVKANFRALGPDFAQQTPLVAQAIAEADADALLASINAEGSAPVTVDGAEVRVRAEHMEVRAEPKEGWQVAADGPYAVGLDLAIDDALRAEGVARELVRAVNDLRKRRDLALDDRIHLVIDPGEDPLVAAALADHADAVAAEVLATRLDTGPAPDGDELALGDRTIRASLTVDR